MAASVKIISFPIKPSGMYFLDSDECRGTTMAVSGFFVSLNSEGVRASFCLSSAPFKRSSLHNSILLSTSGIFLISAGDTPTSQRHQRFLLLMNSVAPLNRLRYLTARGSFLMKSSYSSSSIIKCPPSAGRFPDVISKTLQIGLVLLSTKHLEHRSSMH